MKKIILLSVIFVICLALVSCGSGQKKKDKSAAGSSYGTEGGEEGVSIEEPHWSEKAAGPMTWEEAKNHCETLNEKNFSDWRLPTKQELLSIRNVNQSIFGDTETFWTSEQVGKGTDMVRTVEFRFGRKESYPAENTFLVRCTR